MVLLKASKQSCASCRKGHSARRSARERKETRGVWCSLSRSKASVLSTPLADKADNLKMYFPKSHMELGAGPAEKRRGGERLGTLNITSTALGWAERPVIPGV